SRGGKNPDADPRKSRSVARIERPARAPAAGLRHGIAKLCRDVQIGAESHCTRDQGGFRLAQRRTPALARARTDALQAVETAMQGVPFGETLPGRQQMLNYGHV